MSPPEYLHGHVAINVGAILRAYGLATGHGHAATCDSAARLASVAGKPLDLSRRELDALELLLRRAGRVVSKAALENGLYGFGEEVGSNAVEVLIHRLRKRLDWPKSKRWALSRAEETAAALRDALFAEHVATDGQPVRALAEAVLTRASS